MPGQQKRRPRLKTPDTIARPAKGRHNDRKCIASGEALSPTAQCIRFVLGPDDHVVPDLAGKLPGRGAWTTASEVAVRQAVKANAFSRSFRGQAKVIEGADGLVDLIRAGLEKRALNALGLERRSGNLVMGFEKVKEGLKKSDFVAYIHASDSAADGRDKILKIISAMPGACTVVSSFSGMQLDQALGSTNSVHIGLKRKKALSTFLKEVERLAGFLPAYEEHGGNPE
ncbi:DUF448 domain-containing protein [Parvularcula sp. IMCC14364]|uniref:DUF448 domain-containing protein n=1 Tax=Parvularcula sp. IMCC14364 TaxID=3067902 RepID=UPI0027420428|nr:DUF448 domain-containing protein [Parvularcula sp. IMCC14364]